MSFAPYHLQICRKTCSSKRIEMYTCSKITVLLKCTHVLHLLVPCLLPQADGVRNLPTWKTLGWRRKQKGQLKNKDLWMLLDAELSHLHVVVRHVSNGSPMPGNEEHHRNKLRGLLYKIHMQVEVFGTNSTIYFIPHSMCTDTPCASCPSCTHT